MQDTMTAPGPETPAATPDAPAKGKKAAKPKEPLTLRESVELLDWFERYVEEHVDELELAGGELSESDAALFDEIIGALGGKLRAIEHVLDEWAANAAKAKAAKDREARREKVAKAAIDRLKAYALFHVEKMGGRLTADGVTFRSQRNGQPSTLLTLNEDALLAIADAESAHPLKAYITTRRTALVDTKAIATAYEARREILERDAAELLDLSDVADEQEQATLSTAEIEARLDAARADYVARTLAEEFPGVLVKRGTHLRID